MIGGQPKSNKDVINDHNIRKDAQIGKEGLSTDYNNKFMFVSMGCKALLYKPGFEVAHYAGSEIELRKKILEKIKNFSSYTEYMTPGKVADGVELKDFLTEKGKEIVVKLDQIATELRNLYVEDPQLLDVIHVFTLIEEGSRLAYKQ